MYNFPKNKLLIIDKIYDTNRKEVYALFLKDLEKLYNASDANYGYCSIYPNLSCTGFSRVILFVYRV
ncbi:unnamed protein product [marine sediment metagenome]|uniref:Uncharacterized protein n=1 Tax=marine sediment metagenome TaxID=412755 RepID=X1F8X5_9ZZZZ